MVVKALHKAAEVMKTYYDENHDQAPPLAISQKVWLEGTNITPVRPMKKLADKWHRPFEILEAIRPSSYKLKIPKAWKGIHPVFNEVLLQSYKELLPSQSKPPPPIQYKLINKKNIKLNLSLIQRKSVIWYSILFTGKVMDLKTILGNPNQTSPIPNKP